MLTQKTHIFAFLVSALIFFAAADARAGNVEPVLVGREAVLTAGAVVSTVQDAGAAWFNPAGRLR